MLRRRCEGQGRLICNQPTAEVLQPQHSRDEEICFCPGSTISGRHRKEIQSLAGENAADGAAAAEEVTTSATDGLEAADAAAADA
jgi:hypothetical protein